MQRSKASKYCCSFVFLFFIKNSANLDFLSINTQISKNHRAEIEIVRHLLEHE